MSTVCSSHGHPLALAHRSTSRCPPSAALAHVSSSQGHPLSRAQSRTSTWPPKAAKAQMTSHGKAHPLSTAHRSRRDGRPPRRRRARQFKDTRARGEDARRGGFRRRRRARRRASARGGRCRAPIASCSRVTTAREAWSGGLPPGAPARGVGTPAPPRERRDTSGRTSCGRARRAAREPRARAPPEGRAPARRKGRRARQTRDVRLRRHRSVVLATRATFLRLRGRRECGRRALREVQHRPRGTRLQERLHRAAREGRMSRGC